MPLLQEELELEEIPPQTYGPDWEPGDQLFLTRLLLELTLTDLQAMATTFQHLAEEARHSKETQAATTPLPAYIVEFQSVFVSQTSFGHIFTNSSTIPTVFTSRSDQYWPRY